MRKELIKALELKKPVLDQFMPLCVSKCFEDKPDFENLSGMERVAAEAGFTQSKGMVYMAWACAAAFEVKTDDSVQVSTLIEGQTGIETFRTPVGSVRQVWERRPEYQAAFVVEPIVKTESDLRVVRYIVEAETVIPTPGRAAQYVAALGDAGIGNHAACGVPFHRMLYLYGPENFLLIATDGLSQDLKELMAIMHKQSIEKAFALAGSAIKVTNHQSSWDLGILSPSLMREYYVPYLREYSEILHASGTFSGDHISGENIFPFVKEFEDSGLDFVYGTEIRPQNCKQFRELCKRWQGRILLCLGIDPCEIWFDSRQDLQDKCRRIRDELGDDPYLFGTSDAYVDGTPPGRLELVSDILLRR